jgi:hypothetical protein
MQPIFEEEEVEDPADDQEAIEHPRLKQTIQRDHTADNILGSLRKRVLTRSHLANFCQYYSFISLVQAVKVEKALKDEDWVMAKIYPIGYTPNKCSNFLLLSLKSFVAEKRHVAKKENWKKWINV